jgi:hypothetical protein
MTRISRLASSVLVANLTIMPALAFAQPATAPVQTTVPTDKTPMAAAPAATNMTQPPAGELKAPAHAVKTEAHSKAVTGSKDVTPDHAKLGTKVAAPDHGKLGTTAQPAPAKTAEPGKS